MKTIKILIDENKRLTGYCDFGELQNSIELEVEDDFEFKGNLKNYSYVDEKLVYSVDLEEVKEKKRNELKAVREAKISENIIAYESEFQVRDKDLENFEDVARAIRRNKKSLEDKRSWILADNTVKEFTYAQLLDVLDARALRKENLFNTYGIFLMQLEKSTTVEEIEKIIWK